MYQPLLSLDWNLLFTAITLLVLFVILKHFFFEKVHRFMIEREEAVQSIFDHAEEVDRQAEEKLYQYTSKLSAAEDERRSLIKAARDEAKLQASAIVEDANAQAQSLLEHAQKEIRREQYHARKALQEEIGTLAMMTAKQLLERELTTEAQHEIVDKIIKEAEERPWN